MHILAGLCDYICLLVQRFAEVFVRYPVVVDFDFWFGIEILLWLSDLND